LEDNPLAAAYLQLILSKDKELIVRTATNITSQMPMEQGMSVVIANQINIPSSLTILLKESSAYFIVPVLSLSVNWDWEENCSG